MNNPWLPDETKLLESDLTAAQIAKKTGRTFASVKAKRKELRRTAETPVDAEIRARYWQGQCKSLAAELGKLQDQRTAVEMLCEQVTSLAPIAYKPAAPVKDSRSYKPVTTSQSAVLLFSDAHIGQVVKADQTLGLGDYSFEIFLRRLQKLEDSTRSIIVNHTPAGVREIVIPMLGDMLDGALTHSAECGQSNTLLQQWYSAGHAIAQFFRNLSSLAPLRMYGVVGNHPRWQHQKKMPTQQRNSNYDMFLYCYIQALLRDCKNIAWGLDWQPFATFDVQGYSFYCAHGDNLRGGDKALGIPVHSIGRMVSTTTQLFGRMNRPLPAYYCLGHLHRPISIPHANGEVIVNGAFPGIDGYALSEYFNSTRPLQRLFFMHPKFGMTAQYPLRLDLGDKTPHRYELPDKFIAL